ncbi:hypothetical protein BJV78DRAFT_1245069, partial [Lactifluus subvellereus]
FTFWGGRSLSLLIGAVYSYYGDIESCSLKQFTNPPRVEEHVCPSPLRMGPPSAACPISHSIDTDVTLRLRGRSSGNSSYAHYDHTDSDCSLQLHRSPHQCRKLLIRHL